MGRMLRKAKIYGLFVDEPNGDELAKSRQLAEIEREALCVCHDWRTFVATPDTLRLKIVELISGRTVARYLATGTPLRD